MVLPEQTVLKARLPGSGRRWHLPGPDVDFDVGLLKSVPPLDRLLIAHAARVEGRARAPLPAGSMAPVVAMALYNPSAVVEVFEIDGQDMDFGERKTAPLGNVEFRWGTDLIESDEPDQCAVLAVHPARDRLLMLDVLERIAVVLPDRSPLLVAIAQKRSHDLLGKLKQITARGGVVDTCQGGVLFRGLTDAERAKWTERRVQFAATTRTEAIELTTRPGVFSHSRPDPSGLALAESATVGPDDHVLDLGCGCGLVGLLLAQRMRQAGGQGEVVLVDSNARAVVCAQRSVELNGFDRVQTLLAHDYSARPDTFDAVVANPPYFAGQRVARSFLGVARQGLKPGGRVYMVCKNGDQVAGFATRLGFEVENHRRRGYDIAIGTQREPASQA